MTKMSARSVRPNHSIARGRIAMDGSGFSMEESVASTSSPIRFDTASADRISAAQLPMAMPSSKSLSVSPVAAAISPLIRPSTKAFQTADGAVKSSGLTCMVVTYICHSTRMTATTINLRTNVGRPRPWRSGVAPVGLSSWNSASSAGSTLVKTSVDCGRLAVSIPGQEQVAELRVHPAEAGMLPPVDVRRVQRAHDPGGPLSQYHHPLAQHDRLLDAVGHEQDGHTGLAPQRLQLLLHACPGQLVQAAERLVHEQDIGLE